MPTIFLLAGMVGTGREARALAHPTVSARSSPLLRRLARRRAEQLLQIVQAFRQPRPFAGERALGAGCALRSRAHGLLHLRPFDRDGHALDVGPQRDLLELLHLLFLLLALLTRGGLGRFIAAALIGEIGGVGFVDLLLLFRRRVGTCDIEGAVLEEVVIGVAAARLAASGELGVAIRKRRRFLRLGRGLLGGISAFLEVDRRALPPLRLGMRVRQQKKSCCSNEKRRTTRCKHGPHSTRAFLAKLNPN
ncbi:bll0133 [Bradyrhizobium diazoefficiens USDA 110]|uniref:Bll0133 protein n=1 Tax=Bradyrhizobium diazoefficiens (strain JCM 10833 / BCRC 13528 / IAM 13628 / NBRC 14792 / USDA 110) TaxID=224911 RepID=Q89Y22_BRADU|nr:hypothetical protein CO678_17025 [Bradyrhizobium diazoefficiens]QBP19107.1 hypothetical protein Bdiaspc4_00295 [Bradyrhizobium diazoefficiens]BAC45398.1 bll0133 [Bradyrhizobium diazoefficiens USDA 110]